MLETVSGEIRYTPENAADCWELEVLSQAARIERPEKVALRNRLMSYGLSAALVEKILVRNSSYGQIVNAVRACRRRGRLLSSRQRKTLCGQIWQVGSMDDFIELGRWEGEDLVVPRNIEELGSVEKPGGTKIGSIAVEPMERALGKPRRAYQLREYQEKALDSIPRARGSVDWVDRMVVAPCGAGKTVMGCHWIARQGGPCLVLVHTLDLVSQWVQEIKAILGVDAGVIGGGKSALQDVTVATIQTLYRRLGDPDFSRLWAWRSVVVDECHHIPADTFSAVIAAISARSRLGLTATPYRADGYTPMIHVHMGPIAYAVEHEDLYEAGRSVRPTVHEVPLFVYQPRHDPVSEWSAFMTDLCEDPVRNHEIIKKIRSTKKLDRWTFGLAVCGRVSQCKILAEALTAAGVKAAAFHGSLGKKKRREILAAAKAGEYDVLTATTIADEGLDMPAADAAFFVSPGRAFGKTVQRIGRIMRAKPGKQGAHLYDVVDRNVGLLKNQWYSRRRAYKAIGAHFGEVR